MNDDIHFWRNKAHEYEDLLDVERKKCEKYKSLVIEYQEKIIQEQKQSVPIHYTQNGIGYIIMPNGRKCVIDNQVNIPNKVWKHEDSKLKTKDFDE